MVTSEEQTFERSPSKKSTGKFTGLSRGPLADPFRFHGTASTRRASSVPGNMRFAFSSDAVADVVGEMPSFPSSPTRIKGMLRRTSFSQGESAVEASVSKHPQVELIDDCKGSTVYALSQNFAIVRHGDRLDQTDEWDAHPDRHAWPNDTPLSQCGHERSKETGQAIKKLGKPFGLIVSSPYLRCAQTAGRIAQVLKCPVQLDLDLGEVFDRSTMGNKVTGPQHRDPEKLGAILWQDFPDVVWMQDDDRKIRIEGKQQTFPESLDVARMRFCFKVQQLLQRSASKLMSILIVTHGDAVGCVVGMMKKDWTITRVPFASFALAARQVIVLEKGSAEIKSDEPVYEHEWGIQLSDGLEVEEVHPCSRKRAHAMKEYELKKMKANPGKLDTPYLFDDEQVATVKKVLSDVSTNSADITDLINRACCAHAFASLARLTVVQEPQTSDGVGEEMYMRAGKRRYTK